MVLEVDAREEIERMLEETKVEIKHLREYNARVHNQQNNRNFIEKLHLPDIASKLKEIAIIPKIKQFFEQISTSAQNKISQFSIRTDSCCKTSEKNGDRLCRACGRIFTGDFLF